MLSEQRACSHDDNANSQHAYEQMRPNCHPMTTLTNTSDSDNNDDDDDNNNSDMKISIAHFFVCFCMQGLTRVDWTCVE